MPKMLCSRPKCGAEMSFSAHAQRSLCGACWALLAPEQQAEINEARHKSLAEYRRVISKWALWLDEEVAAL